MQQKGKGYEKEIDINNNRHCLLGATSVTGYKESYFTENDQNGRGQKKCNAQDHRPAARITRPAARRGALGTTVRDADRR